MNNDPFNGQEPGPDRITKHVIHEPQVSICTTCQKPHGMVLEDTRTGEILQKMEKCKDCFFADFFQPRLTEQIHLKDTQVQSMTNSQMKQLMKDTNKKLLGDK